MKVLIDTNVILDFFLSREPYMAEAKQLFLGLTLAFKKHLIKANKPRKIAVDIFSMQKRGTTYFLWIT